MKLYTEEHIKLFKLICSEKKNKEIAHEMGITMKRVEALTFNLSHELKVNGRLGLMLYAFKNKIVKLSEIKFEKIQNKTESVKTKNQTHNVL